MLTFPHPHSGPAAKGNANMVRRMKLALDFITTTGETLRKGQIVRYEGHLPGGDISVKTMPDRVPHVISGRAVDLAYAARVESIRKR